MKPVDFGREEHREVRTDLSHLPEDKRRELEEIVRIIAELAQPLHIILFGSYARGDYKEESDLKPGRWSGHVSDYDLLVIVRDQSEESESSLEGRLSTVCNARPFSAHVQPIVHKLAYVNENLGEGRYFFLDIKRQGISLYSRGAELAEPRDLPPEERRRIAEEYFTEWFGSAKDFYESFEFCLQKGKYKRASFNLNQAAEAAYKCILLVHTLYCPQEHRLEYLARQAAKYGPVFEEIFPQRTREQRDLFELLDKAYIAGRYRMGFNVDEEHLNYLAGPVEKLLSVTEELCRREIERLGG